MAQNIREPNLSEVLVPAKVILFGEHAVVYPGNHAILCPVPSLNVTTTTQALEDDLVYMVHHEDQVLPMRFNELTTPGDSSSIDPEAYVRACVGIAHMHVSASNPPISLVIKIVSTVPVGGFGSSAAVAASIIKAIVVANNVEINQQEWFDLTMQAEKLQHGNPSGADPAVVVYQEPIIVVKKPDGSVGITQLEPTRTLRMLLKKTRIYHTGKAEQSTAETIAHVAKQTDSQDVIAQIEQNTQDVIAAIESDGLGDSSWKHFINCNGSLLEELGVVPEKFINLSKKVRLEGGALKISGGGALSGDSAGTVIAFGVDSLNDYEKYSVEL
jgi:mevalonate kinase